MGELGISVTDLAQCTGCGGWHSMIFQTEEDKKGVSKWWIACGHSKCNRKTKHHVELLDAASEWGLRANG